MIGAALLGTDVLSARPVSAFAANQVFELQLPDRVAYLKIARNTDARTLTEREVAVLEYVRRRGVPVPTVDAYDLTGQVAGVPCAARLRDRLQHYRHHRLGRRDGR
jgi:Ser/Thr protein kinase RdoA (MazF antagonist)